MSQPSGSVHIAANSAFIEGNLNIPKDTEGIVLFAHGAGSSRHSSRNNFVAEKLRQGGLATLLIDLLTPKEKKIDRPGAGHLFEEPGALDEVARLTREWFQDQLEA